MAQRRKEYTAFTTRPGSREIIGPVVTNQPFTGIPVRRLEDTAGVDGLTGQQAAFRRAAMTGTLMSPQARIAAGVIRGPRDASGQVIQRAPTQTTPLSGQAPVGGRILSRSTRDMEQERARLAKIAAQQAEQKRAGMVKESREHELAKIRAAAEGPLAREQERTRGKLGVEELRAEVKRYGIEETGRRKTAEIEAEREAQIRQIQADRSLSDADRATQLEIADLTARSRQFQTQADLAIATDQANAKAMDNLAKRHAAYINLLSYQADDEQGAALTRQAIADLEAQMEGGEAQPLATETLAGEGMGAPVAPMAETAAENIADVAPAGQAIDQADEAAYDFARQNKDTLQGKQIMAALKKKYAFL